MVRDKKRKKRYLKKTQRGLNKMTERDKGRFLCVCVCFCYSLLAYFVWPIYPTKVQKARMITVHISFRQKAFPSSKRSPQWILLLIMYLNLLWGKEFIKQTSGTMSNWSFKCTLLFTIHYTKEGFSLCGGITACQITFSSSERCDGLNTPFSQCWNPTFRSVFSHIRRERR